MSPPVNLPFGDFQIEYNLIYKYLNTPYQVTSFFEVSTYVTLFISNIKHYKNSEYIDTDFSRSYRSKQQINLLSILNISYQKNSAHRAEFLSSKYKVSKNL